MEDVKGDKFYKNFFNYIKDSLHTNLPLLIININIFDF